MFCAQSGLKKCAGVLDLSGLFPLFQPSDDIGVCSRLGEGGERGLRDVAFPDEEGLSQPGTPICFPFPLRQRCWT